MISSMGYIRLGCLLGRKFGRLQRCCLLVLTDFRCEREDTYAFKKPNVVNRPNEQPTTESQPARPSSGGTACVFSVLPTFTSAGWPSSREVLSESDGMMNTAQNEKLKSEEDLFCNLERCLSYSIKRMGKLGVQSYLFTTKDSLDKNDISVNSDKLSKARILIIKKIFYYEGKSRAERQSWSATSTPARAAFNSDPCILPFIR